MALRVLTGIIMTDAPEGSARVTFHPHSVEGDGRGVSLLEIGPAREYRTPPGHLVSLREIDVGGRSARIDDRAHTESVLEISWSGVHEVSYLVIGEVEDRETDPGHSS